MTIGRVGLSCMTIRVLDLYSTSGNGTLGQVLGLGHAIGARACENEDYYNLNASIQTA